MGVEAPYYRRIGVQARAWEPISPVLVPHNGITIPDPGPRAGTVLRRARNASFLNPAPGPLPKGSSWCQDEIALHLRVSQAESWLHYVHAMPDTPLLLVERDLAKKLTMQRGGAYGWDVFPEGLGKAGGGDITEAAIAIGDYLARNYPPSPARWTPVPRGTNSGGPTYGTSDVDKLLHSLMAVQIRTWADAEDVYSQVRNYFDAIPDIHAIVFSRTGPVGKPVAMYDWVLGELAHVANATSVVPRRRAVFGVPSFINMALLGYANVMKDIVLRLPWTAHQTELGVFEDIAGAVNRISAPYTFSDDISGFDQSVRRSHQLAIAQHIYSRYWPPHIVDLWLNSQKIPILAPPLTANDRAFMYTRPDGGVTTSGIITTSLDGTLINLARAVTAYGAATNVSPTAAFTALVARKWLIKAWGDDTVMVVPPSFDEEQYQQANNELGYSTTPVEGATFLMKHYDLSRRAVYPIATRVFQQTVWNEKGGRTPEIELLGLFVRTSGFNANPHWRECWEMITQEVAPLEHYKITTREQLGGVIQDPGFKQRLLAGVRANPNVVADWIAKAARGHVEDVALLAWLGALVGADPEREAKLDLSVVEGTTAKEANSMMHSLASYLSQPAEARPAPPSWVAALLAATATDADDDDDDVDGTEADNNLKGEQS
jgi:hypothetical protein